MAEYHADLMDHLHLPALRGQTPVSVHQILRADRAAFLFMSEKINTLKRSANGTLPLDILMPTILNQHGGLPFAAPCRISKQSKFINQGTSHRKKKVPYADTSTQEQGSWRPNVPSALIGKVLETPQKKRLCSAFNLPNGCSAAKPGETCSEGLHVCAEPGCFKHHSLQQHR